MILGKVKFNIEVKIMVTRLFWVITHWPMKTYVHKMLFKIHNVNI